MKPDHLLRNSWQRLVARVQQKQETDQEELVIVSIPLKYVSLPRVVLLTKTQLCKENEAPTFCVRI